MPGDPVTQRVPDLLRVITAGHRGDAATARRGVDVADQRVREAALGALARVGDLSPDDVVHGLSDPVPAVRRRACDVAATLDRGPAVTHALVGALGDSDPLVVEAACWALGEHGGSAGAATAGETTAGETTADAAEVVAGLSAVARTHADSRAREAAVAALGAIGVAEGLPAVLDALGDKPTVRRRAVVALAAFEGEEVRVALSAAATDRDWQVREVAEILLDDSDGD